MTRLDVENACFPCNIAGIWWTWVNWKRRLAWGGCQCPLRGWTLYKLQVLVHQTLTCGQSHFGTIQGSTIKNVPTFGPTLALVNRFLTRLFPVFMCEPKIKIASSIQTDIRGACNHGKFQHAFKKRDKQRHCTRLSSYKTTKHFQKHCILNNFYKPCLGDGVFRWKWWESSEYVHLVGKHMLERSLRTRHVFNRMSHFPAISPRADDTKRKIQQNVKCSGCQWVKTERYIYI